MSKAPRFAWWIATGFGSGRLRPAPGTWGTLAGLAVWVLLAVGSGAPGQPWSGWMIVAPVAMTLAAVWASGRVAAETGQKDPSFVVADEWAGIWFALTPLLFAPPPSSPHLGAVRLAVPFLLFRLFDIWKPGPVDRAQRLPGGWGIVMDDVLAGLLAGLLTWPVDRWLSRLSL